MSEYAPGPWREYDRNEQGDVYLCGNDNGLAVAIVLQAVIPQIEGRTEANARLIAAAPDMYEALSCVVLGHISSSPEGSHYALTAESWDKVRMAFAKACAR